MQSDLYDWLIMKAILYVNMYSLCNYELETLIQGFVKQRGDKRIGNFSFVVFLVHNCGT